MKKVLSCSKCSLAFPDLPVVLGFNCPQCGTELEIVRPLTKREAERMRLNLAGQKLAHQNPLKEESEKDFCVEEMMKETIVDQSNMPNETEQKVIDAVIDAQAKSVNLEQQAKTLWELECENCIRKGHSLEDPNPDDKWVPLEYHNADKKEIVELLAEVLNQTCEYEDMMESKVKKLEGQIDLFNTLSGELEEQLKQAKKGLNWHKRKNEDLICDLRVATKFGEHETNENESLKKKVAEANKRLGAIGKILDEVPEMFWKIDNSLMNDWLERLRVLTVNEGDKATLSQESTPKIRKVKVLQGKAKEEADKQKLAPDDLVIVTDNHVEKIDGDPVSFLLKRSQEQTRPYEEIAKECGLRSKEQTKEAQI